MDVKASEKLRSNRGVRRFYSPPGDLLRIEADDRRLHELASRLWDAADDGPAAIEFRIDSFDGAAPDEEAERSVIWSPAQRAFHVAAPGLVDLRIDLEAARVSGRVSSKLLSQAPDLAARTVLEAPAAVLLGERGWQILHAGAVVGRRGAVVLRGAAGAGKSTLVAALHAARLSVLADESLFVSRVDPVRIAAAVRDLTLLPESLSLLPSGLRTRWAFSGGEVKRRIDLFSESAPHLREARLAAAVLLGDRNRTPVRLVPLSPEEFEAAFRDGEFPREREAGDSGFVARAWGKRIGFRLDGGRDLHGAVSILETLVR
jgi:hypothetical protein